MRLNVLLWEVESDMNVGLIIRACYMLGYRLIHLKVYDRYSIFKTKSDGILRFSSYIGDNYPDIEVFAEEEPALGYLSSYKSRIIATTPKEQRAISLTDFTFEDKDLIVFGNEFHGLSDEVLQFATHRLVIPMYGHVYDRIDLDGKVANVGSQRCHSLCASAGITLYEAVRQLTNFKKWRDTIQEPLDF